MLKIIDKILTYFENTIITVGIFATTFVLFANVVLRVLFKDGIVWSNEFACYAIIWIVMGGLGAGARAGVHMRITALIDLTHNKKFHNIINAVIHIITALFGLFLLVYGIKLCGSMITNHQTSPAMEIPLWWVYLSLPVGGGLLLIREMQSMIAEIAGGKFVQEELL